MKPDFYRIIFLFGGLLFSVSLSLAQVDLFYYLPKDIIYDKQVPTPKAVIGHEIGEWHISHDKLVYYCYSLAEKSNRVKVEQYGQTYEHRPLLNVIITSEKNHDNLEQIRLEHLKISDPSQSGSLDVKQMPTIIRLGYSVHGNEASGANASLLVAYYLAAAQDEKIEEILNNCIILIDPSLNPDGLQRFSNWVNEHKSKNLNPDINNREFREPWPNGRTNHYWFDLNRDWLLAQHPESIGRLKLYYDWMPNVQTDHHEMESDATFFFQPGVSSRKHPLIPEENVLLTSRIGEYHVRSLDAEKRLYYSKETFDDFFLGKGSTYPDITGSIGILFEQASARGHLRETQNGELSFPFAIKNHFITSLSTVEAASEFRIDLLTYQRDFYSNASVKSRNDKYGAVIIGTSEDPGRIILLGQLLRRHKIDMYWSKKDIKLDESYFSKDKSIVIPLDQPQCNLIKAIFDRKTSFKDSLFYDVSAWNFDLAYNASISWIENRNTQNVIGDEITDLSLPKGKILGGNAFAYVLSWDQYHAPGFVNKLLNDEVILKVASQPFTTKSGQHFKRGTILIPVGIQPISAKDLRKRVEQYSNLYHLKVYAIESGFSSVGLDLGSNGFINIHNPKIAMIVGQGVSAYDAGEVWHLLDQRYDMQVTMISSDNIDRIELKKYTVLVLPSGSYSGLNSVAQKKIKDWVNQGGTLVAWRDALRFVSKLQIADLAFEKSSQDSIMEIPYSDRSKVRGAQIIGGAIFEIAIDTTHPLAYGYAQKTLPVFKKGKVFLKPAKKSIANPFNYTEKPLLSGYVSKQNLEIIAGSPAVCISTFGQGKVIAFADNHNFRAFWYGTNRLFINSIFFGDKINTR